MKLGHALALGGALTLGAIAFLANQQSADVAGKETPPARACTAGVLLVCDAIDSSATGKGSGRYRRVEVPSQDCIWEKTVSDGGRQTTLVERVVSAPAAPLNILRDSCRPATDETGTRSTDAGVKYLTQACACRRAAGVCQYKNDAGTLVPAPLGRTLGPGYPPFEEFSGAGCEPKSCVELLGESSWPTACPGG